MPAPWTRGVRLRLVGEMHGSQVINVMHFATNAEVFDGIGQDPLLDELLEAVLACLIETLLPAVTQDYSLKFIDVRPIRTSFGDPTELAAPGGSVGSLGVASTSFAASLIQVKTGGGGRSGRGRHYLPPAGEAQTAQSELDGPTVVLITQFLLCMAGKFIGNDASTAWRMGVLSQKAFANNPANFDAAFREAHSLSAVSTVACMRSRKKGHGV